MWIFLNLTQDRSKWAQVLYRAPWHGPTCTEVHLPLSKAVMVPQGGISGGIQAKKLSGKETLKVVTFLGNVATKLGFDEP